MTSTQNTYKPVALNHGQALAEAMARPEFKQAWDALEKKYTALHALFDARKAAQAMRRRTAAPRGFQK